MSLALFLGAAACAVGYTATGSQGYALLGAFLMFGFAARVTRS